MDQFLTQYHRALDVLRAYPTMDSLRRAHPLIANVIEACARPEWNDYMREKYLGYVMGHTTDHISGFDLGRMIVSSLMTGPDLFNAWYNDDIQPYRSNLSVHNIVKDLLRETKLYWYHDDNTVVMGRQVVRINDENVTPQLQYITKKRFGRELPMSNRRTLVRSKYLNKVIDIDNITDIFDVPRIIHRHYYMDDTPSSAPRTIDRTIDMYDHDIATLSHIDGSLRNILLIYYDPDERIEIIFTPSNRGLYIREVTHNRNTRIYSVDGSYININVGVGDNKRVIREVNQDVINSIVGTSGDVGIELDSDHERSYQQLFANNIFPLIGPRSGGQELYRYIDNNTDPLVELSTDWRWYDPTDIESYGYNPAYYAHGDRSKLYDNYRGRTMMRWNPYITDVNEVPSNSYPVARYGTMSGGFFFSDTSTNSCGTFYYYQEGSHIHLVIEGDVRTYVNRFHAILDIRSELLKTKTPLYIADHYDMLDVTISVGRIYRPYMKAGVTYPSTIEERKEFFIDLGEAVEGRPSRYFDLGKNYEFNGENVSSQLSGGSEFDIGMCNAARTLGISALIFKDEADIVNGLVTEIYDLRPRDVSYRSLYRVIQ